MAFREPVGNAGGAQAWNARGDVGELCGLRPESPLSATRR